MSHGANKAAYLARLRRIEGQVRGLQRMVEGDAPCVDVLTQVSAVTSALRAVALGLVHDHLDHCFDSTPDVGGRAPDPRETVREATDAIARLVRS